MLRQFTKPHFLYLICFSFLFMSAPAKAQPAAPSSNLIDEQALAHIIHGVPRIYPRRAASAGLTAVF